MPELPLPAQLFQMMTGFLPAQAIFVAAELGIADRIAAAPDGCASVDELAGQTGCDAGALYRVLRTLASVGVFAESPGEGRRFTLTPMAEMLRDGVPGSQRAVARLMGEEVSRCVQELMLSVKTGRPAWEKVYGKPAFEYFSGNPERGQNFDAAMTGIHAPETLPMVEAYDFSGFGTIVDVGGGNASLMAEVLRAAPKARGVVFDLPAVIGRTKGILAERGLSGRCAAEGGDFFRGVPAGGDAYILRHILHDWDDERSVQILRRCREAAAPGGRVLVVESVIPAGNEPHPGKWLDLIMLTGPGGKERTAAEFGSLFQSAGLKLTRIVPTASPVSVVEGHVEG